MDFDKIDKEMESNKEIILVSNSSLILEPTMNLRWFEIDNYIPQNDEFEMILQQLYITNNGKRQWIDIEIHKR
tara:strand:- start:25 stop:243 length:219 start_codon:yes stop_codon:yes gene_type:complete